MGEKNTKINKKKLLPITLLAGGILLGSTAYGAKDIYFTPPAWMTPEEEKDPLLDDLNKYFSTAGITVDPLENKNFQRATCGGVFTKSSWMDGWYEDLSLRFIAFGQTTTIDNEEQYFELIAGYRWETNLYGRQRYILQEFRSFTPGPHKHRLNIENATPENLSTLIQTIAEEIKTGKRKAFF